MHFDRATEIFHDVNAAAHKAAVEQDIAGRSLHPNTVKRGLNHLHVAADRICFQLPRATVADERTVDRLYDDVAVTSVSCRFAPTVSNVMSPCTLSTVTLPESVRTFSSLSVGTVISKSVLL